MAKVSSCKPHELQQELPGFSRNRRAHQYLNRLFLRPRWQRNCCVGAGGGWSRHPPSKDTETDGVGGRCDRLEVEPRFLMVASWAYLLSEGTGGQLRRVFRAVRVGAMELAVSWVGRDGSRSSSRAIRWGSRADCGGPPWPCQKNFLECWIHSRDDTRPVYGSREELDLKAQQRNSLTLDAVFCGINQSVEWLLHGFSLWKIPRSD
jgi:hypothetical protein